VQLQVAIAARKIEGLDPLLVLVEVLSACGEDRLIPAIAWQNLHPLLPDQGERFVRLIGRAHLADVPALAKLLPRAVDRILGTSRSKLGSVREVVARLVADDPELARQALAVISDRLGETPETRRRELRDGLQPVLHPILAGDPSVPLSFDAHLLASRLGIGNVEAALVREHFTAADQPEAVRLRALVALIAFNDTALPEAIGQVFTSGPTGFLARVLTALGRSDNPKVAQVVLARLPAFDPELQPLAVDLLLQREPWARKLLDAVLAGKLPRSTLDANHLRKIVESNDREAIWAVEKAWGSIRAERDPRREMVVVAVGDYLRQHPGDPRAGRAVFRRLCAQCHTIYGEGQGVGPDLTSNGRGSFDQVLASVFDPSLVIGQAYQTTTVVTEGGRNLTGLVVEDSDRRIVLKLPGGGQDVVSRNEVKSTRTSRLSMMPEGIENLLSRAELADLFAFLALDRSPDDPLARPIPGAPGSSSAASSAGRAAGR
jgi:putative heme-binding domain-containing protein